MYVFGSIAILYYPLAIVASGGVIPPIPEDLLLMDNTNLLLMAGGNLELMN